jgi:hypothetical protein
LFEAKGAQQVVDFDWANDDGYEMSQHRLLSASSHARLGGQGDRALHQNLRKGEALHQNLRKGEVRERYRYNVPYVNFHGTCDDIIQQAKNE